MNTVYITDSDFMKTEVYQNFMKLNSGRGNLKIRAYAASEALPVGGLRIIVSTEYSGYQIIFFEGVTDASGIVQTLSLPTPLLELNDLEVPDTIPYHITAIYNGNQTQDFFVNMYDGICVVQNINFIPGGSNGS